MVAFAASLLSAGAIIPFAEASTFTDLDPKGWYVRAVTQLADMHRVSGYRDQYGQELGLFKPDGKVTIAEMLKMGFLASKKPVPDSGDPSNVSAQGDWSSSYVIAAEQMQLPLLLDNLLDVHRFATRAEVIQTLLGIFNVRLHPVTKQFYHDVPLDSPYASVITTATDIGITKGDTNDNGDPLFTFRPDAPINRAEVAVILSKLIAYNPATDIVVVAPPISSSTSSVSSTSSSVSSASSESSTSSTSSSSQASSQNTTPVTAATYRVAIYSVNLRSMPSKDGRVVRSLSQGDTLTVLSTADAWGEVQLSDGTKGYVVLAAITQAQAQTMNTGITGTITTAVNVHAGPDQATSAVSSIAAGTIVSILDGTDSYWLHVRLPDGREGYVGSKFVKVGN